MNPSRKFLSVVIASGLDFGMLTPDDLFRHVTMDILAHQLPKELMALLIASALREKVMDTTLILDTLGVDAIAEHVPTGVLWACVSEAAAKSLSMFPENPGAPTAEPTETSKTKKPKSPKRKTTARKPNRSAPAMMLPPEPPMPTPVVETQVPQPDPLPARPTERAQTVAEADIEEVSYYDPATMTGEDDDAQVTEVEFGEENPPYADGDEVTAFGLKT